MKRIEDIEKMELGELLEVADNEAVSTPEGFLQRLDKVMEAACVASDISGESSGTGKKRINSAPDTVTGTAPAKRKFPSASGWMAVAACSALIAGLVIGNRPRTPKDTFDDPYLAYAELERTFSKISGKIDKSVGIVDEAALSLEKADRIVNRYYK